MSDLIKKAIDRIEMLFVKALIEKVFDDNEIQLVKVAGLADELQDGIERLQNYGMSSVPPEGSEALVAYLNGNRDHGVVIVCDNGEFRQVDLKDGEVVVYSKHGQAMLLDETGNIRATLPGTFFVGNGSDFVAMATKTKAAFDAIEQVCTAFIPPGTPDGGAALAAAISGALLGIGTDVASTNLKAD